MTKFIFQKLGVKTKEKLLLKVYSGDFIKIIPLFSVLCDKANLKGDKTAKEIMEEAGRELTESAIAVIKKLKISSKAGDFFAKGEQIQKEEFPLVLAGGMFKSKTVLETVQKEIRKIAPKTEFIFPKQEPVVGAVRLAIEQLK